MNDNLSSIGLSYDAGLSNGGLALATSTPDTSFSSGALAGFNSAISGDTISLNNVGNSYSTNGIALSTPLTSTSGGGSGTSFTQVLQGLNAGVNAAGSIANSAARLITATNPLPSAGSYNSLGQFIPLAQSSGAIATPGQTTLFGNAAASGSVASSLGNTLGNVTSLISAYAPYLMIAGLAYFVLKLFRK